MAVPAEIPLHKIYKKNQTFAGTLKMISSRLPLNLSLNEGSGKRWRQFHQKLTWLAAAVVCLLTVSGQYDRSFSRRHEGLDGREETNIIIKYDINLSEVETERNSDSAENWVEGCKQRAKLSAVFCPFLACASRVFHRDFKTSVKLVSLFLCDCFTSSNRMSDVAVFLWPDAGSSGFEDEQLAVLPAAFPDRCPPEDVRSALAFTLKKSARVTAA